MQRESNHSGLDVEMVEKEIRRLHQQALPSVFRRFHYHCLRQGQQDLGPISTSKVKPREQGDDAPLAMVETIMTAATRRLLGGDQRQITATDLCVLQEAGELPLEVCLLVDTSGSMNGKRIEEVKLLADQLVQQMHEPLSLITFQESDVAVKVRATRQASSVRAGLRAMNAEGLTPMGEGMRAAVNYVRKRRGKKHLVILITDGLPTWADGLTDPYLDAIEAGALMRRHKIHLICIGLEPQREFLEKLAQTADASLYIVEDLNHLELFAITRREKSRLGRHEVEAT